MYISPLVAFVAVLSFSPTSTAIDRPHENVIRVPLERKSFVTRPSLDSRSLAYNVVNVESLKTHLDSVKTKYRTTLAAYQVNTGFPHPLAQGISVIDHGTLESCQKASGIGTLSSGKLEYHPGKKDATKRSDISLSEVNSNMWMGTISVGTPPQNFTVDFDTGSADLILPDQGCDSSCDGHTRYNPAASSTSINLGKTFLLTYGGGSSANGTQYADSVLIGGYEAVNQTFGAATTYSSGMESSVFPPDGLLGLGFAQISAFGASPAFQTIVSSGALQQAVFGFALSSEAGMSELTIGGTNTGLYQESTVEYVNVSLPAYWQLPLAGLSRPGLNNTPDVVVVNKTSYAQSIVDTGTLLIITSDNNAQAFYANVNGSAEIGGGLWSVPCDIVGSLAPTVTYGSRSFTVSASAFNIGPVSEGSTDCVGGLSGGGSPYWIIGDVFLENVYSIFDVANNRVGFADLS